jgi:hypothetical protein
MTFDSIAFDSITDLPRYGNAQPGPAEMTGSIDNKEFLVVEFPAEFGKLNKLIPF